MSDRTLTEDEPFDPWKAIGKAADEHAAITLVLQVAKDTGADVALSFRVDGDPTNRYLEIRTGTVKVDEEQEDSDAHSVTVEHIE